MSASQPPGDATLAASSPVQEPDEDAWAELSDLDGELAPVVELPQPNVLAILVVHDGLTWLPQVLDALDAQTYPNFDVLVVDNGSTDGSSDILLDRVDASHLLIADRDLGFGAAVAMGLDASLAEDAEAILLVHDDLELAPDAVAHLVARLVADERTVIVGTKLVKWDDPSRLTEVGMSVDITGRADAGIEGDELDQGQRDLARSTLYVSTAGMLVDRRRFDELGRFDRRYHVFRDDLDLCWRAWLAGYDVEIAPDAVGRHAGAASNYDRLGQTAFLGPRYFSERNTLATLLKNYSLRRLLLVLPLYVVVGGAKVLGFVATRRFGDAWQTVRAWMWNVRSLRTTRRYRTAVQATRVRSDAELRPLFARAVPRGRAYLEAVAEWIAGGEVVLPEAPPDDLGEPPSVARQIFDAVRGRPIMVTALVGAVIGLVAAVPLLRPGSLHGGEFAAWPAAPLDFIREYVRGWNEVGGVATTRAPTPAQAVLGVLGVVTFGNAWFAQRLLLLGALPLAWLLALRAGKAVTDRRGPRVAAATAFVLSPPALAALSTGRVSALVTAALLPALVIAFGAVVNPRTPPATAWRATAGAAILTAIVVAFQPVAILALAFVTVTAGVALLAARGRFDRRRNAVLRLLAAIAGAYVLLFPWSVALVQSGSPVFGTPAPVGAAAEPFWRWLVLSPETSGFPIWYAGIGFLIAGLFGIVAGAAVRPRAVIVLWAMVISGAFAAWGLGRAGIDAWAWPGVPLLVAAAGYAGLLGVAFASVGQLLGQHTFGWRQFVAAGTVVVVAVSVVASARHLLDDPFAGIVVGDDTLPAYLATDAESVGPFRVLVLADAGGTLSWDLTGPAGATMLRYGVPTPEPLVALIDDTLTDIASGANPGAAARLGLANVRYVIVPAGVATPELNRTLADQLDLEPQPDQDRLVFRVASWLPRLTFVTAGLDQLTNQRAELPVDAEVLPLTPVDETTWVGAAARPGTLLIGDPPADGWIVTAGDDRRLELQAVGDLTRFEIRAATDRIDVRYSRQGRRLTAVLLQAFALLLAISLMLRPPRFASREDEA